METYIRVERDEMGSAGVRLVRCQRGNCEMKEVDGGEWGKMTYIRV